MPKTDLLSVRIAPKLSAKLDRLAKRSGRSKSWHVNRILEDHVEQAAAEVEAILEALNETKGEKSIPHEKVMAELRAIIASHSGRHKAAE